MARLACDSISNTITVSRVHQWLGQ